MTELGTTDETDKQFNLRNMLNESSQLMATGLAACYLIGFVIVNSFLGKYGIRDFDTFKTEYLVAGMLFIVVIGLWFYFVGRNILRLEQRSKYLIERYQTLGGVGIYWKSLGFVTPLIEVASNYVLMTIMVAAIFCSHFNRLVFILFGFAVFVQVWMVTVETSAASKHISRWAYLLLTTIDVMTVVLFYFLMDEMLSGLAFFFLAITLVTVFYADISRYMDSKAKYAFLAYSLVFALIIGSGVGFGAKIYGQIKNSLGGGKPMIVRVIPNENELPVVLKQEFGVVNGISNKLYFLGQSESEFYLQSLKAPGNNSIRIKRDLVKAVLSEGEETVNWAK